MSDTCGFSTAGDPFDLMDGAYALGTLEPAEREEFEAHLITCGACRSRVAELGPVTALLNDMRGSGDQVDDVPEPETLLPGLLRKAARERNRRRWFTASIGAVAAACVITLVAVLWPAATPSSGPAPQAFAAVRSSPVHATAQLTAKKWGTEIGLRCRYDYGVRADVPYDLTVIDRAGTAHPAGSWTLVPGTTTRFTGGTSVPRGQIRYVQITLADGTAILQLAV